MEHCGLHSPMLELEHSRMTSMVTAQNCVDRERPPYDSSSRKTWGTCKGALSMKGMWEAGHLPQHPLDMDVHDGLVQFSLLHTLHLQT